MKEKFPSVSDKCAAARAPSGGISQSRDRLKGLPYLPPSPSRPLPPSLSHPLSYSRHALYMLRRYLISAALGKLPFRLLLLLLLLLLLKASGRRRRRIDGQDRGQR